MCVFYFDEKAFLFGTRNMSYDGNLMAYGMLCFCTQWMKLLQNKA